MCISYLLFLKQEYPSTAEKETDELVQWCHGAPGFILMYCAAYRVFHDEKYLNAAKKAVPCIWKRGLLKKGMGLCHG